MWKIYFFLCQLSCSFPTFSDSNVWLYDDPNCMPGNYGIWELIPAWGVNAYVLIVTEFDITLWMSYGWLWRKDTVSQDFLAAAVPIIKSHFGSSVLCQNDLVNLCDFAKIFCILVDFSLSRRLLNYINAIIFENSPIHLFMMNKYIHTRWD